jgi:23S rRNA U2552 (ribose-2'-O)-methylase RlmE/FtsJ
MINWTLPSISLKEENDINNKRSFEIKEAKEIKSKLDLTKSKLDKLDKTKLQIILRNFDVFRYAKTKIFKLTKKPITNATLKFIELWNRYVDPKIFTEKKLLVHFDNASFPGTFIIGADIMMNRYKDCKYEWYASSLIPDEKNKKLGDIYGLYKNHKDHWLMTDKLTGDVTDINMQLHIKKLLGGKVDLYTSDLGFDSQEDYNSQEVLHILPNLGQVLSGLLVLRKGGIMIFKQYTYFEPFSISLLALLTTMFNSVEISKPETSKPANSEIYIICSGFNGMSENIEKRLLEKLAKWDTIPLIPKSLLHSLFINSLVKSMKFIYNRQIQILNDVINCYNSNMLKYTKYEINNQSDNWYLKNIRKKIIT